MAIGLFDSGLGGLTVMKELMRALPEEKFFYLADTAGSPYGHKSPDWIIERTLRSIDFLLQQKVDLIVIACFTASIYAQEIAQKKTPIPVIGMISPLFTESISTQKSVVLLGTRNTIQSGILQRLLVEKHPAIDLLSIPCPLFVPFIEEGWSDHPSLFLVADRYLAPAKEKEVLLLACTHYPLISSVIQRSLPQTQIINGTNWVAKKVQSLLPERARQSGPPSFYVTTDQARFQTLATSFLGISIPQVSCVELVV
ncbi:MAG: glutamate racemase [Verrucomicrobiota bacterium]|nr:glutamate racemase [Verrucomicrobiota bacterium]